MPGVDPPRKTGSTKPLLLPSPRLAAILGALGLLLAALAGCSAPVREQAKAPGGNAPAVRQPKAAQPVKAKKQPKAVLRGTIEWQSPAGASDATPSIEECVVFVAGVRKPGDARRPERAVVGQTSSAFTPRVTVVAVGDTVVFENRDRIYHSVFSVSPARRFEIGSYGPGLRRNVAFNRPGSVRVFCDMHESTSGYVYVVPSPVAARPNRSGKWVLPALPLGRYELRAWHPEAGERRWTVDLTAKGLKKDLRF